MIWIFPERLLYFFQELLDLYIFLFQGRDKPRGDMEREDQVGFNTSMNHLFQLRESMFIIRKIDVLSKSFQYHESILINVFLKKKTYVWNNIELFVGWWN